MEQDQLKQFAADARPLDRPSMYLDLQAFGSAWREGGPLPCFSAAGKNGKPMKPRYLGPQKLNHVLNSPLSPDVYEAAHGVHEVIVRFLRGREEEVRQRILGMLRR